MTDKNLLPQQEPSSTTSDQCSLEHSCQVSGEPYVSPQLKVSVFGGLALTAQLETAIPDEPIL